MGAWTWGGAPWGGQPLGGDAQIQMTGSVEVTSRLSALMSGRASGGGTVRIIAFASEQSGPGVVSGMRTVDGARVS